jgi:hypothetical protein
MGKTVTDAIPRYTYAEWAANPEGRSHGATLWGSPAAEVYSLEDLDEAIEHILDASHPDPLDGTIEIVGVTPDTIPPEHRDGMATILLENLLEWLGEECAAPDGEDVKTKPEWSTAARAFVDLVADAYPVYVVHEVVRVVVDVPEWVRQHRPEWLESQT